MLGHFYSRETKREDSKLNSIKNLRLGTHNGGVFRTQSNNYDGGFCDWVLNMSLHKHYRFFFLDSTGNPPNISRSSRPEVFAKFAKIHRKIPVPKSLF